MIQKEHDFLITPPIEPINATLKDYGIPSDWKIQTRFVQLINKAITPEMYKRGTIVLEKAQGKDLSSEPTKIPFKFQFGALMGYIDMMRQLSKKNIALDSNIDTDLFIMPDVENHRLDVVRIDCMSSIDGANELSAMQSPEYWRKANIGDRNLTYEQLAVDQVIEITNMLYPKSNPTWNFLGSMIPALSGRFKEADINSAETLFDRFKDGLARANWNDDFVKNGDNSRLQKWVGGQFKI